MATLEVKSSRYCDIFPPIRIAGLGCYPRGPESTRSKHNSALQLILSLGHRVSSPSSHLIPSPLKGQSLQLVERRGERECGREEPLVLLHASDPGSTPNSGMEKL